MDNVERIEAVINSFRERRRLNEEEKEVRLDFSSYWCYQNYICHVYALK